MENKIEKATFAAGCFWGVEERFRCMDGVLETVVGYIGGHKESPSYEDVCSDETGHAEAVQVTYDPEKISFVDLLDTFWKIHDPTTPNRQGPDVGSQYRSAVFYHNEGQKEIAEKSKKDLQDLGEFEEDVVTEIVPAGKFYEAEEYHQKYLMKQGRQSCSI